MTEKQLVERIHMLTEDIEFSYKGESGSICPFSISDISLAYGNFEKRYDSIQNMLIDPVIKGKCLREIVGDVTF